jgi:hypothetical protein
MPHANLPAAARADAAIERNQRLSGFEQNRLSAAEVSATCAIADIERIEFGAFRS